uniref:Uncharacterized protein n=1 Tax=viral metagenome TaxID=1070528 RepID=A0A6C0K2Y9_9ZZZZ
MALFVGGGLPMSAVHCLWSLSHFNVIMIFLFEDHEKKITIPLQVHSDRCLFSTTIQASCCGNEDGRYSNLFYYNTTTTTTSTSSSSSSINALNPTSIFKITSSSSSIFASKTTIATARTRTTIITSSDCNRFSSTTL